MTRARSRSADSAHMRGVVRTLEIIRALNQSSQSTISGLSALTGIPRPSIYRLLDTLCDLGYVRRRENSDCYTLTSLIRTLSDGFRDEFWISEIVSPILAELQGEIVWPTDVATFLDDAMHIRETTRPRSPLTIDRATIGLRIPMLSSASGKAYLAFSDSAETEVILERLRSSQSPENALAHETGAVAQLLDETRRNGYGERSGSSGFMPETSAIAVPVRLHGRVMACLNITFITSALTPLEAAGRYLDRLYRYARRIEKELVASDELRGSTLR